MNRVRAAFFVALSVVLPSGVVASCDPVSCNSPGYEAFIGRLVDMRGTTATYVVDSVVGGEYPTSTAKVGRRRAVRYSIRDAELLRVGTSYRVELNGGGPGVDSSMHDPCSVGTRFTDGSTVVAETWWQRNHVVLAVAVALGAAVIVAAAWARRRRSRGADRRLRA